MDFIWRDGERTIIFGRGVAKDAVRALGGPGYLLLTTPRLQDTLPPVVEAAGELHHVPGGLVPELAAAASSMSRRRSRRRSACGRWPSRRRCRARR